MPSIEIVFLFYYKNSLVKTILIVKMATVSRRNAPPNHASSFIMQSIPIPELIWLIASDIILRNRKKLTVFEI